MSSSKFYGEIKEAFQDVKKVQLKEQYRLNPILSCKEILLRKGIELKSEKMIKYLTFRILESMPKKDIQTIQKGMILTRKNGTVYNISKNLKIQHDILDNSNHIHFPSWIGLLFGDYTEETIQKEEFKKLVKDKLNIHTEETIESYWQDCKQIENSKDDGLNIEKLHVNMIISDTNHIENIEKMQDLMISTIHKAKGKEFENVYLDNEIETLIMQEDKIIENAKLLYVAITRAKENCYRINAEKNNNKVYYGAMPEEERYFEYLYKRNGYKKGCTDKKISKIEIGLEKDIDKTSFIDDQIIGNAIENINYIKNHVHKNDYVDLILEEGKYYIYHHERKIGKMNIETVYEQVQKYLNKVKEMSYKPIKYEKVKIKRLCTISMFQEFIPSEIQNIYAKTGMWIGIELEGFGELKWG